MDNFNEVVESLIGDLKEIKYSNGDIGDLGNEIGISIWKHINAEEDFESFIHGLRHGLSLKNGTH
jgi:hypothetical protein